MTGDQEPGSSRRSSRRRRHAILATACAVIVLTAVGCSGSVRHGASKPGPLASIAARTVPPPPRPCAVSSTLVNSCRPWLGAAAGGNPGAPKNQVAQFLYLERLIGHHLDVFRDYNSAPGKDANSTLPLNHEELAAIQQPGTYPDINWEPSASWADADGGNAAVNAEIKKVAGNIKAVAPHKIFLTIWFEPQHDVSGGSNCPNLNGHSGTPAQYRQMWRNVEGIFRAQGVDNVVWTMDYMGSYANEDCLVPQLWPGNSLVDWVLYDTYDHDNKNGTNWSDTVGRFYHVLQQDSTRSVDFDSKPWGLGEFGTCQTPSTANSHQYFLQAKQSIESNAYPRLKMYLMFAVSSHGHTSKGCLPDYDPDGQPDVTKNSEIKAFANSPLFNK
ncbi:MAG TPA: glycosyl hydrolase [Streptosporangiaceae bacterium]|jgi:hypothetical protein|nr:glycosyl hydrolase [Streptosporangiaceae bacterium]